LAIVVAFELTSALAADHKDEVERILFFNGNQAKVVEGVAVVARRWGIPRLRVLDGRLRITLDPHAPQTLYAMAPTPAGPVPVAVVVYVREEEALSVLFLAVHEQYAADGAFADAGLVHVLLDALQAIARRVKGITTVSLHLGRPQPLRISVRRG
jgi:hypothetical protein